MKGKYRLFGKIPVVDILIVLVLVALCVTAVWLLTREEVSEQTGAESQVEQTYPFTTVLMVKDIVEEYADLPVVGDELYFKGGTYFGKIPKIEWAKRLFPEPLDPKTATISFSLTSIVKSVITFESCLFSP